MPTLQLDDVTFHALLAKAAEVGLSAQDWVKRELTEAPNLDSEALSAAAWEERFLSLVRRHRPTNHPLDDSRESIYE